MEKKVTKEQVKKIAELSKLNLSQEEVTKFSQVFTDILGYINVLNELNLEKIKPTFQVTGKNQCFYGRR